MTVTKFVAFAAIASQLTTGAAFASCPVIKTYNVPDSGEVRKVHEAGSFVVYRAGLRVNTDGASNSYHPIGRAKGALNTLCNGIAVYPSSGPYRGQRISSIAPDTIKANDRCQLILDIFRESMSAKYAIPKSGTINWYALAMEPGKTSAGFYRPCVQNDNDPHPGFFVAQTAIAADTTKSVCNPAHWLNSTQIPYVTLPKNSPAFKAAGVKAGDLAIVHRKVGGNNRWITAIVADTGNSKELGEGSLALHAALGNPQSGSGFNNLPADVTTFIFKRSAPTGAISAATLAAATDGLIAKLGGPEAQADCLK